MTAGQCSCVVYSVGVSVIIGAWLPCVHSVYGIYNQFILGGTMYVNVPLIIPVRSASNHKIPAATRSPPSFSLHARSLTIFSPAAFPTTGVAPYLI